MEALENRSKLAQARLKWKSGFEKKKSVNEQEFAWSLKHDYWVNFCSRKAAANRYVTFFGVRNDGDRMVEINIPFEGNNRNIQGAIAVDERNRRWVLHQGRLHHGRERISSDQFKAVPGCDLTVDVHFSNGDKRPYLRVANLDASPSEMQEQTESFIRLCESVRTYYSGGQVAASQLISAKEIERVFFLRQAAFTPAPPWMRGFSNAGTAPLLTSWRRLCCI